MMHLQGLWSCLPLYESAHLEMCDTAQPSVLQPVYRQEVTVTAQQGSRVDAACADVFSFVLIMYLFLWFRLLVVVEFRRLVVLSSKELSHCLICNALFMLFCSIEQAALQSYCVYSQKHWLKILASGLHRVPVRQ